MIDIRERLLRVSGSVAFEAADIIDKLVVALENINQVIDARSELFTSDADVFANLQGRVSKALKAVKGEQQ